VAAVEAQGLEVRPARVGRSDLLAEFWKQYVALVGAVLLFFVPLQGAVLFSADWSWDVLSLFVQLGLVSSVVVAVGHVFPTWWLRRVDYLWTGVALHVSAAMAIYLAEVVRLGLSGSFGWTVLGLVITVTPVVMLSLGLRALVPALRPSVRLRWHARGDG